MINMDKDGFKWGVPEMGAPQNVQFFEGKSHLEMDENWGYPYFRKPPCVYMQDTG